MFPSLCSSLRLAGLFVVLSVPALLPSLAEASPRPAGFRPTDYRNLPTQGEKLEGASLPKPGYPFEFRRSRAQISAAIRVYVNERGDIDATEVAAVAGDRELANFAAEFGKAKWKFPPRTLRGKPVKYQYIVPVTFLYDGGEKKLNDAIRALNSPLIKPLKSVPWR